ncbi:MAG TPA: hemolysin III family protein [Gemmatimonadota bacterium]|jgi:hemolysin III|nr:hemolysin III family protein [Gemmatimonadota bacterium]
MERPRITLGKMQNPVRGFLHGTAAVTALAASVALVMRIPTLGGRIAGAVFGISMVALYTTSSLYHSVPWREMWKRRMQRLDHSMIFVLIAGTYTPIAWIALGGWMRAATLLVVWMIALVGIAQQSFFPRLENTFGIALMTTMGWLAVFIMIPFFRRAGAGAALLMALGGVLYTVGMVFLVTNKPRLWPRIFSYHELFHVMVVAATSLHFVATWRYVAPLAA